LILAYDFAVQANCRQQSKLWLWKSKLLIIPSFDFAIDF